MNKVININDYPYDSGKTTTMIEDFRPEKEHLLIPPLLSEVTRVIESSKDVVFVKPYENDDDQGTRASGLEKQLLFGNNIPTTHTMHERLVPFVKAGLLDDYDIIIDVVPIVVKSVASKFRNTIQELYVEAGYMDVDGTSFGWRIYLD